MRWGDVARLYLSLLRARLGLEAFAFAGVAVGVALLFSVQVSNQSLGRSIEDLTHAFVGSAQLQLAARDAAGFDERYVDVVAGDPNVAVAAPVLQVPANVVGPAGERGVTLLAADSRASGLGGTISLGVDPQIMERLRGVALPAGIATSIGVRTSGQVRLQVGGRTFRVPLLTTLSSSAGTVSAAPIVLAPLVYGQELADARGRVSRIYVRARPGREAAVRRLLESLAGDRLDVRAGAFDERVFAQAAEPNDQSSNLYAQVTALVGFMFALNAMLLIARARRKVIATIRLDGIGARTRRRLLTLDAVMLGLTASVAGLLLGDLLSRWVLTPAPGYLSIGFPVGTGRTVSPLAVITALAAGVLAALLGTFAPLAARSRDRSLRVSARSIAAAAAVLGMVALVWFFAPKAATVGVGLLVVACVLLLPAALSGILAVTGWLMRRTRTPVSDLAVGEVRASGTGSVVLCAVAAIAVFASGAIEGARRDLQAGLDTVTMGVNRIADVWIAPTSDANQLGTDTFKPAMRDFVATLPHVARVDVYRGELLTIGTRRMWVFAPAADSREIVPASQIVDGDPASVQRRIRSGPFVSVSRAFAAEHDLQVGDTYTLPAPRPQRVRVAAITTNIGWPPGAIVTSTRTFRAGWGAESASALQVQLEPGTSPQTGRRVIADALARTRWTGLTVETAAQREAHQRRSSREGLARLRQISLVVLLAASAALAIALGALVLQRRRALALLRLDGVRGRHVRRALLLEIALLVGTGAAVGGLVALAGAQLLDRWLVTLTGFPVLRSSGLPAAGTTLVLVTAAALLATAPAVYHAANVDPAAAFDE